MRLVIVAVAAALAAPAVAQTANRQRTIDVSGHGKVSVPPDTARIHYWVRGEGKTPDDAARSMVAAQTRVESGLKGLLGGEAKITNSDLLVIEARNPKCNEQIQLRLSEGDCAIIGYLARSEGDVTTSAIDKAGTAVGLASRLGASDARLTGFELNETAKAGSEAMRRAVADAREQAQILAAAAGEHLGRVMTIQYGSYPIIVTGSRIQGLPAAPPPPPPVQIDVNPRPQDITADVSVSYELIP